MNDLVTNAGTLQANVLERIVKEQESDDRETWSKTFEGGQEKRLYNTTAQTSVTPELISQYDAQLPVACNLGPQGPKPDGVVCPTVEAMQHMLCLVLAAQAWQGSVDRTFKLNLDYITAFSGC